MPQNPDREDYKTSILRQIKELEAQRFLAMKPYNDAIISLWNLLPSEPIIAQKTEYLMWMLAEQKKRESEKL